MKGRSPIDYTERLDILVARKVRLVPTYSTNGKVLAFHNVDRDKNFNYSPFERGGGGGGVGM